MEEDFVGEGITVVMKKLEEYLVVVGQKLGWRGMRNQIGFWNPHPESKTHNKLYCLILWEIYILSFY